MGLKDLTEKEKAKAFDMIIERYGRDTDINQFGKDVQEVIKFFKEFSSK